MIPSGRNRCDAVEARDLSGRVSAGRCPVAKLSEQVITPGPDRAVALQGAGEGSNVGGIVWIEKEVSDTGRDRDDIRQAVYLHRRCASLRKRLAQLSAPV